MAAWAVPYFVINLIFLLAYTGVLSAWCMNWFKFRQHPSVSLHKYIGVTVAMQLLLSLVLTIYYGIFVGGNGTQTLYDQVYVVLAVFGALASGIMYSVLILIAKGFCIVSPKLSTGYKSTLSAWIILFIILRVINDLVLVTSFLYYLIEFIVLAMFLAFIFYIFRTTVFSIRLLQLVIQQAQEAAVPMQPIAPNQNQQYPQNIQYPPGTQFVQPGYPQNPQYPQGADPYVNPVPQNPDFKDVDAPPANQQPPVVYVNATVVPASYPGQQGNQVYYAQAVAGAPAPIAVTQPPLPTIPDAPEKLKLMMAFHKLILVYIVFSLILNFLPDFAPGAAMIFSYLQFLLVLLFLSGICFVFRMRVRNHYFYTALDEE